jgi:hypothetical protein
MNGRTKITDVFIDRRLSGRKEQPALASSDEPDGADERGADVETDRRPSSRQEVHAEDD